MKLLLALCLTAAVAGPQLYALTQSGQISGDDALFKAGLVLVAFLLGFGLIARLAAGYRDEHEAAARRRERELREQLDGLIDDQTP